jgi:DNA-binding PadR family transcriptional regulator
MKRATFPCGKATGRFSPRAPRGVQGEIPLQWAQQISGNQLALNQGTLYPALLKLEQMGWIASKWGESESGRRVKVYSLTRVGRKQLHMEEAQWQRATGIVERFFKISEDVS